MHPPNLAPAPYETLTPRESQLLRMPAEGLGNKEIAGQLGIMITRRSFTLPQSWGSCTRKLAPKPSPSVSGAA
jgi:FixJ family two-component response regulator